MEKRSTKVDCTASVREYVDRSDWRVKANANSSFSAAGLVNNLAGKVIANYWLDEIYSKEEGEAHRNGDYHIHDLDILGAYCFTKDTKIKTVEYGDISIAELLEKNITCFTVISFDGEKRVECNARNLRCTRKDAELVEVEFGDGLVIRCTPDHKFLALTPEIDPETHEAYLKVEWKPAAYLTMRTVRKAYTCPIIKSDIIKLEEVEGVITESDAKNSFAKVISVKHLNYKEDVYCMTVEDTHCFALENGVIAHNCCGHDLQKLLQEGFNGVVARVGAKPPKHFREALYQMANYLGILQAEWAGAQAFSSFDTLLAPYVFYDMMIEGIDEKAIRKAIVNFVYNLNVPSRWGQSPFTNITIDWTVPSVLKDLVPMRGDVPYFVGIYNNSLKEKIEAAKQSTVGESKYLKFINEIRARLNDFESDDEMLMYSLTYKNFQKEMDIINRCFYQVMSDGDKDGQPFTFPIPTINITEDFDWDNPNCEYLFENTAKYGHSYFQNFIGSQYLRDENGKLTVKDPNAYSPNDLRSMCPLTLDTGVVTNEGIFKLKELNESTHKVRTNMARWANFKKSPIYDNHQVLRITFENKTFVDMSTEHLQYATKYENGEITGKLYKASELEVGMKCLFMYDYRVDDSRISHVSGGDEWAITQIERLGVMPTQCIEIITDNEDEHEFRLANGLMTHNCRLQLDKKALRKRGGGLFGSDSQTGSIGVVTLNMARLGYLYKGNMEGLKTRIKELCDMASSTLEKKRKKIIELNEMGLFPYTRRYINTLDTFFSTIGVNGMNEMVRNFTNDEYDITDSRGQEMAKELLDFINGLLLQYQDETGTLYNLEATPAEGTTYRFAREDKKRFEDIIQAGCEEAPYYTNSSQLPVDFSADPFSVLELQDDLQKKYTGGTVLHLYMSERISTPEACKQLVKKVLSNYRLPYISITPSFSVCPKHGYISGDHEFCPLCDKEIMAKHAEEVDFNR